MKTGPIPGAVLITGGGSGIGLEIAKRFVQDGQQVLVLNRTDHDLGALSVLAQQSGAPAPRSLIADVTDAESMSGIQARLDDEDLELRIVVAGAGINIRKPALELTAEDVDRMLATNVAGVISTFRIFAPMVIGTPHGRLVAIGSVSADYGMPLRATYSATKAAVSGLVRGLAMEWSPHGVTVNAVAPGIIDTPLTRGYLEQFPSERRRRSITLRSAG